MNKKGFTLIELLAVIVLLAIVGVVGANIIIKRLNTAKRDTFIQTYNDVKKIFSEGIVTGDPEVCFGKMVKNENTGYYNFIYFNSLGEKCNDFNPYKAYDVNRSDFELNIEDCNGLTHSGPTEIISCGGSSNYRITLRALETGSFKNVKLTINDKVETKTKAKTNEIGDTIEGLISK